MTATTVGTTTTCVSPASLLAAAASTRSLVRLPASAPGVVVFLDFNPLNWLGDQAQELAADGFTSMMMGLWSAAMWLLQMAFEILDAFVTPNVADPGLRHLYGVTVWVSLVVALAVGMGQIGLAVLRQDGRGFATLAAGVLQYGAVVSCWVIVCAALVAATAGLTTGLLQVLLEVDTFSGYAAGDGWVDQVSGTVEAATLGVCAIFVLVPAGFGYLVIMLVRAATLLILTATMPIAAAGALGDGSKAWMWKSVRWFLAACLMSPLLALVLGLGVQIAQAGFPDGQAHTQNQAQTQSDRPAQLREGEQPPAEQRHRGADRVPASDAPAPTAPTGPTSVDASGGLGSGPGEGSGSSSVFEVSSTSANIGMSVVGAVIMLVACFTPMVLFRLLAFVDPGTASGASFRSTMSANGGVAGLLTGRRQASADNGSGAATQTAADGRTASESSADAETANRFRAKAVASAPGLGSTVGGMLGGAMAKTGAIAGYGASVGVDVLGQSGVGNQSYYDTSHPPTTRSNGAPTHVRAHDNSTDNSPDNSSDNSYDDCSDDAGDDLGGPNHRGPSRPGGAHRPGGSGVANDVPPPAQAAAQGGAEGGVFLA